MMWFHFCISQAVFTGKCFVVKVTFIRDSVRLGMITREATCQADITDAGRGMKILIYAYNERQSGESLEKLIQSEVENSETVYVSSYSAFNTELCKPFAGFKAVVIFLKDQGDVDKFSETPVLFEDKCLILILPGEGLDENTSIWRLQPTYYCYADGNHLDVISVLQRVARKYKGFDPAACSC